MLMMCTRLLSLLFRYTRIGLLPILFTFSCLLVNAQTATRHYIPPAPWQYWSRANELVITTLSKDPVEVTISRSDGTFIGKVTVSFNNPVAYRFEGEPENNQPYPYKTPIKGAGIIIESSTADIYVNVRNVMSDVNKSITDYLIKGNASMVSFGDQGLGINFRLGYYRSDYRLIGWNPPYGPVYSILAVNDNTVIKINGIYVTTLMAGEGYLFQDGLPPSPLRFNPFYLGTEATQGSELQASAPIVVAVSTLHDSPGGSADGVMDQIAPNTVLGTDYLIVRGEGRAGTASNFPEQTSIIATEDNTQITLRHFNPAGLEITSPTQPVITLNKGETHTFHQGDAVNAYSTSSIKATKKILVLYGTGIGGEVDISTVPPLNACAGSDTLETIRFMNYNNEPLKYFGFIVSDSPTDPVTINGISVETLSGPRIPIGNTGYYLIKFDNKQLGDAHIITVRSKKTVAVSFTQRKNTIFFPTDIGGPLTSMSSYFSLFNKIPKIASVKDSACNRKVLIAEPGLGPYQWYKDDDPIPGATDQRFIATENGNYSYSGTRECGVTAQSPPLFVEAGPIEVIRTNLNMSICKGQSYNGHEVSGTFTNTFLSQNGCDSIVTVKLTVHEPSYTTIDTSICEGNSFKGYNLPGTYVENLTNQAGCDSILTIHLSVYPVKTTLITDTICEGNNFNGYTKTGQYIENHKTVYGCDSTVTINLTVLTIPKTTIQHTICEGESYKGYTQSGTYTETYISKNNCDSIVTIELTVFPKKSTSLDTSLCEGTTLVTAKGTYNTSGTYTETYKTINGCDSIVTITLSFRKISRLTIDTSLCLGATYMTPKGSYSTTGIYTEIYTAVNKCDSIVTINLTINPTPTFTYNKIICQGEVFSTPKGSYNSSATYTEIYQTSKGCDSTVTFHLTVHPLKYTIIDTSLCEGQSLTTPQNTYKVAGTYKEIYKSTKGCDSTVTINLSIIGKENNVEHKTICEGDSYRGYTSSGTYFETRTSSTGCAANFTVFLTVLPNVRKTIDTTICFGTTYTSQIGTYSTAGTYTEVYPAASKCDSIVTINLKINSAVTFSYNREICQGETFNTPIGVYTASGTYTEVYKTIKGCDSTVTLKLTVNQAKFTTVNRSLCEGQLLTTPIGSYSEAGTYTEVYKSFKGCDSTVTINLTYRKIARLTIDRTICEGEVFEGYSQTGIFVDTFIAKNDCDSIRTINLTVISKGNNVENRTICEGESYNGYTTSGTYFETRTSGSGCAANFTVYLTVLPKSRKTIDTSICFGTSYTSPKGTYSAAGTYTEIYKAANSCDSIVTIKLKIDSKVTFTYSKEICQSEIFSTPIGNYTASGTYTEIYKTTKGCDSIVTVQLTVLQTTSSQIDTSICQGQQFKSYTKSGNYKEVYKAVNGCDSTVIINLIVKPTYETNLNKTICEGESFKGYTTSGSYKESYTALNGCDSIVNINLTVLKKSYVSFNRSICQGDNFRGFTTTGTFVETFTAANGCDSIITTSLTVLSRDTVYESKTICEGESYRGFTQSGSYIVPFSNQNNCESIIYVNLNVLKKSYLKITQNICEGESFRGYSQSGMYTEKYVAANGCDSIVTIDLRVIQKQYKTIRVDICEGSSHKGYTETGIYTEKLTSFNGCDSFVTTILTVRPHTRSEIYRTICDGQQLDGYSETGTYTDTLINRWGCDSIRVLHLTVEKKSFQFFEGTICQGEQYMLPNGKQVSNTGIYVDTLRTRFGCDSLVRTTTITLKPGPIFSVSKSNDINCVISQAQLTVSGGVRYLWTPSTTLDSATTATPIATPKETTTYNVRVWGRNGCSFTKDITVYADFNGDGPRYPIPSAFTPNKDGLNDCFHVRHWGPVQNFKMDIFNRWGEKVFSTTNIQSCWDGTFNKIPLPTGVFIYKISANGPCGNMFRTGQITLIR